MQKNLLLILASAVIMLGNAVGGYLAGRAAVPATETKIVTVPVVSPVITVAPKVEPVKVDEVPAVEPGVVSIVTKDDTVLSDADALPIIGTAEQGPGEYQYHGFRVGNRPLHYTISVRDGTAPIPPPPLPVPPTPPVVVPTVGPREILIVRESKDSTPAFSQMLTKLRKGPAADYLASKSHKLWLLDVDSKGPDGKPSPLVEAWRPYFASKKLPVELIIDPTTKKPIGEARELPVTTTADDVVASVKAKGG